MVYVLEINLGNKDDSGRCEGAGKESRKAKAKGNKEKQVQSGGTALKTGKEFGFFAKVRIFPKEEGPNESFPQCFGSDNTDFAAGSYFKGAASVKAVFSG